MVVCLEYRRYIEEKDFFKFSIINININIKGWILGILKS